ncbi:GntR family transcriptional regulator [Halobacterium sp. NMX12-1]|uniref:GntR family transcriptional regulator n=1 Tax=Halobacterium sp. NMX12-1 TaxID=3166650 RepID=A0AAU8C998_9EURY
MNRQTGSGLAEAAVETLQERYEFLDAVRERPRDKRALVAATDVSRSTVDRALRDLESHGLVERAGGEYRATTYGDLLAGEFASLLDTAAAAWEIRDVLEKIPTDELGFELSRLADADVTTPTSADPTAPMQRVVELKRGATRVRSLASGRSPGALDAHEEAAGRGDHLFASVCSTDLLAWLASDPERREQVAGLLDADSVEVYAYDGDIPFPVGITEDVVFFGVESEEGAPVALVETTDERVREWAIEAFETRREAATELERGDLADYAADSEN